MTSTGYGVRRISHGAALGGSENGPTKASPMNTSGMLEVFGSNAVSVMRTATIEMAQGGVTGSHSMQWSNSDALSAAHRCLHSLHHPKYHNGWQN